MVFQSYALYPHMTVYENMAFALKLRKVPKEEIDKKVRALEMLSHPVPVQSQALSGGQHQPGRWTERAVVMIPGVLMDGPPYPAWT